MELGFAYFDTEKWVEPPNCWFLSTKGSFDHVEQQRTLKYSAVGIGWMLRKAKVLEPNGLEVDADGKIQFKSATAGQIMATLIPNAKGRGWGTGVDIAHGNRNPCNVHHLDDRPGARRRPPRLAADAGHRLRPRNGRRNHPGGRDLFTVLVTRAYYVLVRLIEQRFPQLGILLGLPKAPTRYADANTIPDEVIAANNETDTNTPPPSYIPRH